MKGIPLLQTFDFCHHLSNDARVVASVDYKLLFLAGHNIMLVLESKKIVQSCVTLAPREEKKLLHEAPRITKHHIRPQNIEMELSC